MKFRHTQGVVTLIAQKAPVVIGSEVMDDCEIDPQVREIFDTCEQASHALLSATRSRLSNIVPSTATESDSPTRGKDSRLVKTILGAKKGIKTGYGHQRRFFD